MHEKKIQSEVASVGWREQVWSGDDGRGVSAGIVQVYLILGATSRGVRSLTAAEPGGFECLQIDISFVFQMTGYIWRADQ